jgi:hypothetical protein
MKNLIACVISIWLIVLAPTASATDVRGRIDTRNPYNGYYQPLPRAEVALFFPNGRPTGTVTITGFDGFYYFYNVPPGNYVLVVNRARNIPVSIPPAQAWDIDPVLF